MSAPVTARPEPLRGVTSIKLKLGLLVAVSVFVAVVLATVAVYGAVPWWLLIPVAVAMSLAVTQLLAIGMTSPLREMTRAVARMAGGDYAVRVRTRSTDEVGQLAAAFNQMAHDLGAVDRQRRELIANVAHELRTPVAALGAQLENLADGVVAPTPDALATAAGQATRLGDLLGDLLDLSRVEAGASRLETGEVDVAALVAEVVAELEALPRRVTYAVRVEPSLLVVADRARLRQVLVNLLDNAARHSPAGGAVEVSASRQPAPARMLLEVVDTGAGIAPEDRERVFDRFVTASSAPGAAAGAGAGGGTGLGLAISRWVTQLHGGSLSAVSPRPGTTGARLRLELPVGAGRATAPPADARPPDAPPPRQERSMTSTPALPPAPGAPGAATPGLLDGLMGDFWPEDRLPGRRGVLLACLAIGLLAALAVPFPALGVAATAIGLAAGLLVGALSRHRARWFTRLCGLVGAGSAVLMTVRSAEWITVLSVLAGVLLTTAALVDARRLLGFCVAAVAWPLAGLRGMPWLGRTLAGARTPHTRAVVRTVVLSVLAVLVFLTLLGTADPVLGHWVGLVVPQVHASVWVLRVFVLLAVTGVVLAMAYLALNPPGVDEEWERRPARHRYEWLAPVLVVDAVLVLFVAAQAAAYFGGHAYVESVTGLTYADYVHQGFGQLTAATVLTLLVVGVTVRKARVDGSADRWWLRGALGALGALTLLVVWSALHRMDLYQEAYGFTRLRLLVDAFELWLGVVVAAVMVAGLRLRGGWLPRFALVSGAAMLLGLGVANPDAWIARHNVERYHHTGRVDWGYLSRLSADAVPTLAGLPRDQAACALAGRRVPADTWGSWNLSRHTARRTLDRLALPPSAAGCGPAR